MAEQLDVWSSIILPAIVSLAVTLSLGLGSYIWNYKVNSPTVRGLRWGFVGSNPSHPWSEGWIVSIYREL